MPLGLLVTCCAVLLRCLVAVWLRGLAWCRALFLIPCLQAEDTGSRRAASNRERQERGAAYNRLLCRRLRQISSSPSRDFFKQLLPATFLASLALTAGASLATRRTVQCPSKAPSIMSSEHASPIKTPQQLIVVIVLAFLVPVAVILLLANFVTGAKREGAGSGSMTPEAVADRLRPVGTVALAGAVGPRVLQSGEAVYKLACSACHSAGVAGAPKTGDTAAWAPRLKQGYDTLVKHAVEGFKAMPAKGGNADLDPIEVARAVAYMGNQAGAKFTEPAAPAGKQEAAASAPAASVPTAAAPAPAPAPAATAPAAAPVAAVAAAATPVVAKAGAGEALYKQACTACHVAGVAGAPKSGDKAAWAPRIKQGIDALTASVIKGKGAMPPKGGSSASEADIRAAVEYMVSQAK